MPRVLVTMPSAGLSPDIAAPAVAPTLTGASGSGLFAELLAAAASTAPADDAATATATPPGGATAPNVVTLTSLPQTEASIPVVEPVETIPHDVPVIGPPERPQLPETTIPPSRDAADDGGEDGATFPADAMTVVPAVPTPMTIAPLPAISAGPTEIGAIGSPVPAEPPVLPDTSPLPPEPSPTQIPRPVGAASSPLAEAVSPANTSAPPAPATTAVPAAQAAIRQTPPSSNDPTPPPSAGAPRAAAPEVNAAAQTPPVSPTTEQASAPARSEADLPAIVPRPTAALDDTARAAPPTESITRPTVPDPATPQPPTGTASEPTAAAAPSSTASASEPITTTPPPTASTARSSTPDAATPIAPPARASDGAPTAPPSLVSTPAMTAVPGQVEPVPPAKPAVPVISVATIVVAAEEADPAPETTMPPVTERPARTQILSGSAESTPAAATPPASLPREIAPVEDASGDPGESAGDDADQPAAEPDAPDGTARAERMPAADRAPAPQPSHHGVQPAGVAPATTTDASGLPTLPAQTSLPAQTAAGNPQQATLPSWIGTAVPVALPGLAIEIARQARAGSSQFEIRLDPPELGRVDVSLNVDREGKVKAHLVVDRMETLDFMLRDQRQLEKMLAQAGFKTDQSAIDFSLRSDGGGFGQGQAQQHMPEPQPRWTPESVAADEATLARTLPTPSGNLAGRLDLTV